MIEKSELLRVPVFVDLPDDQIAWFLSEVQELRLQAGETYLRQGDPADSMFVVLEGQLQARGELGGETIIVSSKPGDVTGVLPFSRMKQATVTGRAVTESRLLRFPASLFPELVQKMPELTKRLVGVMSDRIREVTRIEQQRDRLASLGKLSAGVAHELNQPASAPKRATSQLRTILTRIKDASHALGRRELTPARKTQIEKIESSTSRISDLVRAIKEYTYMDQGPVQNVDIVKSLETTLTILNHKLKHGVAVQRDYQRVPFLVNSFGSELNQVWTNLIDNAIDAMGGKGELRVRTYREDTCVVVEIGDNGPGISPEVKPHIFEPFFTTKGVGEGTGLGLDTVQRIVKKHQGNIQVNSKPGDTRFQVWLPLAEASA